MNLSFDVLRPAGQVVVLPLGDTELRMIWCPPGSFRTGDNDTTVHAPSHKVTLTAGFWVSETAVIQRQWTVVVGSRYRATRDASEKLPVEAVTWERAIEFCRAVTEHLRHAQTIDGTVFCSLPSEAQWEFACRAGTTTPWYFGSERIELTNHAWFDENSGDVVHEVGLKKPNPWGLYDTYGNIAEWCLDDYAEYGNEVDPIGELDGELKILRGGSYADSAARCRSAARASLIRTNPFSEETGFRIVLNPVHAWSGRSSVIAELIS